MGLLHHGSPRDLHLGSQSDEDELSASMNVPLATSSMYWSYRDGLSMLSGGRGTAAKWMGSQVAFQRCKDESKSSCVTTLSKAGTGKPGGMLLCPFFENTLITHVASLARATAEAWGNETLDKEPTVPRNQTERARV